MKFHYELLSRTFNEIALKILAKVVQHLTKKRKVKAIFYTLVSKHPIQQDIEDKLLYLIQLWFDTFMMHEDEFKEIIALYKTLRKEGVVFPPRDPTAKFMIQFKGQESPIFQTIEENKVYEEPTKQLKATGGKVGTKDFISASFGNPSGGISSNNSNRPAYLGQNYEAQQQEQDRYMEEDVEQNYHMEGDEVDMSHRGHSHQGKLHPTRRYHDSCTAPQRPQRRGGNGSHR